MNFRTKIDWWIGLAISFLPITCIWLIIKYFQIGGLTNLIVGLIMLIISITITPLFFITYIIEYAKCSLMQKKCRGLLQKNQLY